MKASYDPDADAAYIQLKEGKVNHTKKINDNTLLDVNKKGDVLGVELLFVKENKPRILRDLFGVLKFKKYTRLVIDTEKVLSLSWLKKIM
ncbi:DUF2283 domain-containing protein [Candidatus Woesearchaeota archaeon]|nr:DUF2283 domain-containing protein [Candidatus Woesearchaeota archaeon]